MTDVLRGERPEGGRVETSVVDVDVHEMLTSIKDLVPYLEESDSRQRWLQGASGEPLLVPAAGGRGDTGCGNRRRESGGEQAGDGAGAGARPLRDRACDPDQPVPSHGPPDTARVRDRPGLGLQRLGLAGEGRSSAQLHNGGAQEPKDAAREIDRLGSDPRFVQVILPAVAHHVFGRTYYWPIFEAAQRHDLVVAFHQSGGTRTAVGLPPYYTEWHTAISQAWQSQLISLIAGGVFDEFEELKVAMVESSWTWVPHLMWRFDYNYRSLRREVPWVKRLPSESIRERVRFSTRPMEYPEKPEDLYSMFEMIGSDELLMFATDYPHWDFDCPEQALPRSFPKVLREKVLSGNARKFYSF